VDWQGQSPHQSERPQLSVCQPQLPPGQPVDWQPIWHEQLTASHWPPWLRQAWRWFGSQYSMLAQYEFVWLASAVQNQRSLASPMLPQ
jgi:hypothetical protein